MRSAIILLIARQFWNSVFKTRAVYLLYAMMILVLFYAAYSGIHYHNHNDARIDHQEMARESWENNPDKHPHRMAHFGSFAFRLKHPLSIFDFGIESYTGNAVFLEAHKQNMVNFSEASFSTGILRFGELSMAMVLQTLLPLIIFFLGFGSIASDRENGTLKIMLTQGASWQEILFGRSLGLLGIAMLFTVPFLLSTLVLLITGGHATTDTWMRFGMISIAYLLFTTILCLSCIGVSASSQSSKHALTKLLGIWLLMVVLIPRTSQALGSYFHPSPNKLEFRSAIEEEVLQNGDSHNPNDPLFNALRDSVLAAHQVDSVTELPFNYGGFVMSQGEKLSTQIYLKHHNSLLEQYRNQNQLTRSMAFVNPYLAIKHISMALSASDFESYVDFQKQAESYRYQLAQRMNALQMKYISAKKVSGSEGKVHVVNRSEWKAFPKFHHHYLPMKFALQNEALSLLSILFWTFVLIGMLMYLSRNAKAI